MSYFDLPEVQEERADLRDALNAAWHDARDHGYDDHTWADMVRGVAVDSTGWGYLPGHAPIYVGLDSA